MDGMIFDIQRFSIYDGPGIRTNVFLQGCPLSCPWCHNPEGIGFSPQLGYSPDKCIHCGACVAACPMKLHTIGPGGHAFSREGCIRCFACADACPSGALTRIGRSYTLDEVMDVVLKDRPFYEQSGGGLTLTGGEPMAQALFAISLAARAKKEGLHVCVETSGCCIQADLIKMADHCDLFLFDVKETDARLHRAYTGVPMALIHENLRALDEKGAQLVLRCPVIPGYNAREDHFLKVAQLASSLKNVQGIELEPYHPLGISKCERIGRALPEGLPQKLMTPDEAAPFADILKANTSVPVKVV